MLKLWVAQDTRLVNELEFYEENFSRPRGASVLFTPQPGKSLLSREAFDEVFNDGSIGYTPQCVDPPHQYSLSRSSLIMNSRIDSQLWGIQGPFHGSGLWPRSYHSVDTRYTVLSLADTRDP